MEGNNVGLTMSGADIFLIVVFVIAAIVVGIYFLNKWAYKKMDEQQVMVDKMKMVQPIYVIDKKHDRITNVNMPKMVMDQMPARAKLMKMYFVQAKIGPQIITFITDKLVYDALPLKKQVKVEIAGIYIVKMIGMKSKEELKAEQKAKKEKEKEAKKAEKIKK